MRFTKDHEWVSLDGDIATVGISCYAADQLGDVVFVEVPEVGKTVKAGEGLAVGEAGGRVRAATARAFLAQPRAHWLELADQRNLPLTAIHDAATGMAEPAYVTRQAVSPLPSGGGLRTAGAYMPSFPARQVGPAPTLGADTARVLAEFGAGTPA